MAGNSQKRLNLFLVNLIIVVLLTQCTLPQNLSQMGGKATAPSVDLSSVSETVETKVEILFRVQVPDREQTDKVYLDLLDEVTGLALNSKRFPMAPVADHIFEIEIAFKPGSLIKYRYARDGNPIAIEHNTFGEQVRYRMFHVFNPGEINDIVSGWNDTAYLGETGRIQGNVTDVSNNPLPDILITAGGVTTISTSDGSFLIEGIPPGTHNVTAWSINGDYLPYQQGALVAANSTTPAPLMLPPTHIVNITFILNLPDDFMEGLPIRMIGNIYSLGNTFANLSGGISVSASRAPYLTPMEDGRYSITLALPAGLDLRYKYTLGDGFWNTEHSSDGSFRTRQLIVPDTDQVVEDTISSWTIGEFKPVVFELEVPESTPQSDIISIQFNPYTWTEPVQMWPTGSNRWMFILQSPLHLLSSISYRYCRNEQCGVSDPAAVVSNLEQPVIDPTNPPQLVSDRVLQWEWMDLADETRIVGREVNARGSDFIAGIELLDYYEPDYQTYYSSAFQNMESLGANWTVLTPSWHYTTANPPVLEAVPGKDPLWHDLLQITNSANDNNLKIAIFPQSHPEISSEEWWSSAARDAAWWQSWFDRYRTFLLHYADFAEQINADALILGEENMLPALPNGLLPDGDPSNVFLDAGDRWGKLIEEIRRRYSGSLFLAVQITPTQFTLEEFEQDFDQYYILVSSPLKNEDGEMDIHQAVTQILDEQIYPLWESTGKPIVLGIKYPSTTAALDGCIVQNEDCLSFDVLDQPVTTPINVSLDLNLQFEIYEAFLTAVNEREWINGLVSRGYYVPAALQDLSSSIHGKPAAAMVWYWYPRFLSTSQ